MSQIKYQVVEKGVKNTTSYRIYFADSKTGKPISPFHDIPLTADGTGYYNMVVEIPRWSNAKMEICTTEPLNPIKQDVKKGALRYVKNCYPHHGYIWNYGAIPQTWEDPSSVNEDTGCKGDNDPIDVCEIGSKIHKQGAVIKVKVLGCFALIDEGETDWKIIAIDVTDPLADQLNDIEDVEKLMPGLLKGTNEWFRIYKIPDGKPENSFAFNGAPKGSDFAKKIILNTHQHWVELQKLTTENNSFGFNLTNTTLSNSNTAENSQELLDAAPAYGEVAVSEDQQAAIDKSYFLSL